MISLANRFDLFVPGKVVPQGSMKAMTSHSTGHPVLKYASNVMAWRSKVTSAAIEKQMEYAQTQPGMRFPFGDAIGIRLVFVLERPLDHFGTGKNANTLKASAPRYPGKMPDLDKLQRAIFDALTDAQVWKDDGQVVWVQAMKHYPDTWPSGPGVHITLGRMK